MIRIASLRDLDAAICDHVMQWRRRGRHPLLGSMVWATGHSDTMAPLFSTDPTASYALETKMRELGWYTRKESTPRGKHTGIVWLNGRVFTGRSDVNPFIAFELAALAALGVELELVEGWDKC